MTTTAATTYLRIFRDDDADKPLLETTDGDIIAAELDEIGVRFERWDADVIAPVLDALEAGNDPYRVLLLPDHATPCNTKTHSAEPVPYLLFDSERPGAGGSYTEPATQACAPVAAYTLMGRLVAQE